MREIKPPNDFDKGFRQTKEAMEEARKCVYCGSSNIDKEKPTIIKVKDGKFKRKLMQETVCNCIDCGFKYATSPYPLEQPVEYKLTNERKEEMRKSITIIKLVIPIFINLILYIIMVNTNITSDTFIL
jgi:hypothetical protein